MHRLLAPLALCALVGCAAVTPTPSLDPAAAPDPSLGYVAGSFSVAGKESRFAFRVSGQDAAGFHLAFGEPAQYGFETRMIPLPPGVYRVDSWVTYSPAGTEQKRQALEGTLGAEFVVKPGHVVYLGRFTAATDVRVGSLGIRSKTISTTWTIQPQRIRADEVAATIRAAYPAFEAAPLECVLCSAPLASADVFARPVVTPDAAGAGAAAAPPPAAAPAEAKARPQAKPEPQAKAKPQARAEPRAEPEPEPQPEPQPKARKPRKEVQPKSVPEDRDGLW